MTVDLMVSKLVGQMVLKKAVLMVLRKADPRDKKKAALKVMTKVGWMVHYLVVQTEMR